VGRGNKTEMGMTKKGESLVARAEKILGPNKKGTPNRTKTRGKGIGGKRKGRRCIIKAYANHQTVRKDLKGNWGYFKLQLGGGKRGIVIPKKGKEGEKIN